MGGANAQSSAADFRCSFSQIRTAEVNTRKSFIRAGNDANRLPGVNGTNMPPDSAIFVARVGMWVDWKKTAPFKRRQICWRWCSPSFLWRGASHALLWPAVRTQGPHLNLWLKMTNPVSSSSCLEILGMRLARA